VDLGCVNSTWVEYQYFLYGGGHGGQYVVISTGRCISTISASDLCPFVQRLVGAVDNGHESSVYAELIGTLGSAVGSLCVHHSLTVVMYGSQWMWSLVLGERCKKVLIAFCKVVHCL